MRSATRSATRSAPIQYLRRYMVFSGNSHYPCGHLRDVSSQHDSLNDAIEECTVDEQTLAHVYDTDVGDVVWVTKRMRHIIAALLTLASCESDESGHSQQYPGRAAREVGEILFGGAP